MASIGADLRVFARAFADAKIDRSKVQILGPALWIDPASGSGASAQPGQPCRVDFHALETRYLMRSFDVHANPVLLHSVARASRSVWWARRTESQAMMGAPRTTPTATY